MYYLKLPPCIPFSLFQFCEKFCTCQFIKKYLINYKNGEKTKRNVQINIPKCIHRFEYYTAHRFQ